MCPEVELIHPSEGTFGQISDQWCMGENPHPVRAARYLGTILPHSCETPNSPDGPPFGGSIGGNGVIFLFQDLEIVIFFPNLPILGTLWGGGGYS